MTYKLLYNDAVAMTGGQPAEGGPTVLSIAHQLHAEGIGLLADRRRRPGPPARPSPPSPPARSATAATTWTPSSAECASFDGVSAIIYDQVCATEKRRRRKRGKLAAAPDTHVSINTRICENCGDCTVQSNCIAIEPVDTEYGRKRRISPTSCNTDLSCLKGFCPSFVTTKGAAPEVDHASHWKLREAELAATLPDPVLPTLVHQPLARPVRRHRRRRHRHLQRHRRHGRPHRGPRRSARSTSPVSPRRTAPSSPTSRSPPRAASTWSASPPARPTCSSAPTSPWPASPDVLGHCAPGAGVVGNLDLAGRRHAFLKDRDLRVDAGLHRRAIERHTDRTRSRYLRGSLVAERLFGTAQAVNTVLLGMAWQLGPWSRSAARRSCSAPSSSTAPPWA